MDVNSLKKNNSIAKFWILYDFNERNVKNGMLSMKNQQETDCKQSNYRILYESYHFENMGEGCVINAINAQEKNWTPIPPGSINELLKNVVCSSKIK